MKKLGLTFLKLGGSLITDKNKPLTHRPEIIRQIALEILETLEDQPELRILIGHGSGSFGHAVADQYQTQQGGEGWNYWEGFTAVWWAARQLNQYVIDSFHDVGLPVIAYPPSAAVIARNRNFERWDIEPLTTALSHNLIPVVYGDVIFDTQIGGTIFSTEKLFQYLSQQLQPERILLAGLDHGVYQDVKNQKTIITKISPTDFQKIQPMLSGAQVADVTGGMLTKVKLMLELLEFQPDLYVRIFSGLDPRNIKKALSGEPLGTLIAM